LIEFVLYKFDLKEVSMKEIIKDYICDKEQLVNTLYESFTRLFSKDLCSYALYKNNENLEVNLKLKIY